MNRLIVLLVSIQLCTITMSAQSFTEHLTRPVAGQGTVTVHQDSLLDNIVNGKKQFVPEKKEERKEITGTPTGKKMRARGYRIQVYWGGSARTEQSRAQHIGNKVTALYPELQAYTTFESPNWRCRVGDFVTYKDAEAYLKKFNETQVVRGAMIVKSEVYIYQ